MSVEHRVSRYSCSATSCALTQSIHKQDQFPVVSNKQHSNSMNSPNNTGFTKQICKMTLHILLPYFYFSFIIPSYVNIPNYLCWHNDLPFLSLQSYIWIKLLMKISVLEKQLSNCQKIKNRPKSYVKLVWLIG